MQSGLGRGSMSEFGCRTQTLWKITKKGTAFAGSPKTIRCDCCGSSFETYVPTDKNRLENITFLCTMCEDNVQNDINLGMDTRNTKDELYSMKKTHLAFFMENTQIDSGND